MWCERLERLARNSGFARTRIWLIANEGFSEEALQAMSRRRIRVEPAASRALDGAA